MSVHGISPPIAANRSNMTTVPPETPESSVGGFVLGECRTPEVPGALDGAVE